MMLKTWLGLCRQATKPDSRDVGTNTAERQQLPRWEVAHVPQLQPPATNVMHALRVRAGEHLPVLLAAAHQHRQMSTQFERQSSSSSGQQSAMHGRDPNPGDSARSDPLGSSGEAPAAGLQQEEIARLFADVEQQVSLHTALRLLCKAIVLCIASLLVSQALKLLLRRVVLTWYWDNVWPCHSSPDCMLSCHCPLTFAGMQINRLNWRHSASGALLVSLSKLLAAGRPVLT